VDHALLRAIPSTFDRALVGEGGRSPDVGLARAQHAAYRAEIERAGYAVEMIPADDDHPDCVFIEDTAVVIVEVALITRPGAESRRGETGPVAESLGARFGLAEVLAPGTIDGGDVMAIGGTVWVGRSARTNEAGIATLADVVAEQGHDLVVVPVESVLHLKSAVLPVGADTVVVTPGAVDESLLDGLRIVHEEPDERHMFSSLPLRDGRVLVTDSAPRTAGTLEALGIDVHPLGVSEILAADGGLTCMSILYST
jgi:dimethylargininase